jgi:hypothetical protein
VEVGLDVLRRNDLTMVGQFEQNTELDEDFFEVAEEVVQPSL